jgi:hypothetical protein
MIIYLSLALGGLTVYLILGAVLLGVLHRKLCEWKPKEKKAKLPKATIDEDV